MIHSNSTIFWPKSFIFHSFDRKFRTIIHFSFIRSKISDNHSFFIHSAWNFSCAHHYLQVLPFSGFVTYSGHFWKESRPPATYSSKFQIIFLSSEKDRWDNVYYSQIRVAPKRAPHPKRRSKAVGEKKWAPHPNKRRSKTVREKNERRGAHLSIQGGRKVPIKCFFALIP